MRSFDVSVRLAHVFEYAKLHLLGDLQGRSYVDISKCRNCGRKTLLELHDLVRQIQHASPEEIPVEHGARYTDPNVLSVHPAVHSLLLKELPVSVRLENALQSRGWKTLGDLHGIDVTDLLKVQNCGRRSITELRALVSAASGGRFSATDSVDVRAALRTIAEEINAGLSRLSSRNRKIFEARLFGNSGNPRTLQDVGEQFRMTRERVRQIIRGTIRRLRRGGGPRLARALELGRLNANASFAR